MVRNPGRKGRTGDLGKMQAMQCDIHLRYRVKGNKQVPVLRGARHKNHWAWQAMRKKLSTIVAGVMFAQVAYGQAYNACFEQAAKRYRVPAQILRSISSIESGGNPAAFHRNANGSWDVGHM